MSEYKQVYCKRIVYVDCYKGGVKVANVGFVRLVKGEKTGLQLHISDSGEGKEGKCSVYLMADEKEIMIGEIELKYGKGDFRIENPEEILMREIGEGKEWTELKLKIAPDPDTLYMCVLETVKDAVTRGCVPEDIPVQGHDLKPVEYQNVGSQETDMREVDSIELFSAETPTLPSQQPEEAAVKMQPDKWKQLTDKLSWTRPFRDERWYLLLDLTDMIMLPKQYYRLVENSFLLHGYYNYGHLVLARICRRGMEKYYIGVPGNFYEKEKQVAVLFGFESFESKTEPAKEGDFGYYMIGVDI